MGQNFKKIKKLISWRKIKNKMLCIDGKIIPCYPVRSFKVSNAYTTSVR